MQVWAVRIALLTKLRLYSIAEAECQQFAHMDSPELHFEFHHKRYPNRSGECVGVYVWGGGGGGVEEVGVSVWECVSSIAAYVPTAPEWTHTQLRISSMIALNPY